MIWGFFSSRPVISVRSIIYSTSQKNTPILRDDLLPADENSVSKASAVYSAMPNDRMNEGVASFTGPKCLL
jgi:hypothetical protein